MARPLRLEAEGAIYHVLNRGYYRADIFWADRTKAAFLTYLGEACGKAGWRVDAWCIMSNYYHLAVETPQGNLVGGMQRSAACAVKERAMLQRQSDRSTAALIKIDA